MFLGSKGGRCVGLKPYHLHVPTVLKSGSLNLLEASGPFQACNGIALPFYYRLLEARGFTISTGDEFTYVSPHVRSLCSFILSFGLSYV